MTVHLIQFYYFCSSITYLVVYSCTCCTGAVLQPQSWTLWWKHITLPEDALCPSYEPYLLTGLCSQGQVLGHGPVPIGLVTNLEPLTNVILGIKCGNSRGCNCK